MTQDSSSAPPQKKERPRDELGRPLPWGTENRLQMEDFDSLPPEECHRRGVAYFNQGRYFLAHEAWESAWRQLRGTGDEEFFHGLAQLGAGFTHQLRGNPHGARVLTRRAIARLGPYGSAHAGLDLRALLPALTQIASDIEASEMAGGPMPRIAPPRL